MLEIDFLDSLKQLAQTLDHNPHDIPALEEMITEISSSLNDSESIVNHPDILKVLRILGMGINRLSVEKAMRRIESEGRSFIHSREVTNDLDVLTTTEGSEMAKTLRELFDEIHLDEMNKYLRNPEEGGDYLCTPRSDDASFISRSDIFHKVESELAALGPEEEDLKRPYLAYLFFMQGWPVSLKDLQLIFSEKRKNQIMRFFTTGLFFINEKELVQMNSLVASSLTLNGKTLYLLSDHPVIGEKSDRVYLGMDSWTFLKFLARQNDLSGTGVDLGSGSGIQGIGCAIFHDAIDKVVLFEIDERSRHLSTFNAVLNGVKEKIEVATSEEDLVSKFKATSVSFITTNPPYMPYPEFVELSDEVSKAASPDLIDKRDGRVGINFMDFSYKAGWGGADGLSVIKNFLTLVEEIGEKGTRVYIFSPLFPIDSRGTPLLETFVKEEKGWDFHFELFQAPVIPNKEDRNFVPPVKFSKFEVTGVSAMNLVVELEKFFPANMISPLLELVRKETEAGYERHGIHEFHNGFATVTM